MFTTNKIKPNGILNGWNETKPNDSAAEFVAHPVKGCGRAAFVDLHATSGPRPSRTRRAARRPSFFQLSTTLASTRTLSTRSVELAPSRSPLDIASIDRHRDLNQKIYFFFRNVSVLLLCTCILTAATPQQTVVTIPRRRVQQTVHTGPDSSSAVLWQQSHHRAAAAAADHQFDSFG